MLNIKQKDVILSVIKDGERIFGELFIDGIKVNSESEDFGINLADFENQKLNCVLDGKKLFYNGELIKTYENVFRKNTVLDMEVRNGTGKILIGNTVADEIKCGLKRSHYKVNVTSDDKYTIVRYTPLHIHTENSLLDGIIRIPELVNKAEYACAITDHGNMFGWYDMWTAFNKAGKKPIIGEEFYISTFGGKRPVMPKDAKAFEVEELMFDNSKAQNEDGLNGEHLIVLAKNNTGIKNLFWLSSQASNHFYRKPHITFEELFSHKEGLIVCSACIASGMNQFIKEYLKASEYPAVKEWIENYGEFFYEDPYYENADGKAELDVYAYNHRKSREWIRTMRNEFGDDFYLEYQDHHFPLEKFIMEEMVRIRNEEFPEIKIVATNDAHYLNKEDAYVHELFLCNQTRKTINDPKHMKFSGDGYYVYSSDEMISQFPEEYLDSTLEITDKISYKPLSKGYHLPHYPLPEGFTDDNEYLKKLVRDGFKRLFKGKPEYKDPVYLERVKTEMGVIRQMGWPSYFLIVQDFIRWAEDTDVRSHWKDYFPNRTLEEIPPELLKDYPIMIGTGRGCVCAGTKIYTENELKNIESVEIGEKVRTHNGLLKTVTKTHKYPIKENLYRIHCLFGDNYGNAYTGDHKILVIKHVPETNKGKIAQGIKYRNPDLNPVWVSAKDVEPGDYVIQPKFDTSSYEGKETIDLAVYAAGEKNYSITDEEIVWKKPNNSFNRLSTKLIKKNTGVSYSVLRRLLDGKDSKFKQKINSYLIENGCSGGIDEYKERYSELNFETYHIPRYLPVSSELMFIFGLMTGDGWTRKNRREWGICFNSDSFSEENITVFEKMLNIRMGKQQKHKTKKLLQYSNGCIVYKKMFEDFWNNEYDYTARTKTFQSWVFGLSEDLRKSFLEGLWYANGTNSEKTSFDSASFKLIERVKILLCSLNIANGLQFRKEHISRTGLAKNNHDSWKITVPKNFGVNNSVRNVLYGDGFVAKRVDRTDVVSGEKFVYDITVEDDHSYVTSSFIAHNSGAGSLINYCLGITKVDPIVYDLKFERFLNPDRISMPDIDTDIEDALRSKVLEYVRFKYDRKNVANIITFGTAAAKNSIKTINRVLEYSVANGDSITKLIPDKPGIKIKDAMDDKDFKDLYNSNPEAKKIIDLAMRIEGLKTSQSIHPCGVVCVDEPVTHYMPEVLLEDPETGEKIWVSQMEGPTCEDLGCLKMDFLGLRTLGYVHEALNSIKKNTGKEIDYEKIPLNDMEVYRSLAKGNTASIFQCESDMFTTVIRKTLKDTLEKNCKATGEDCFSRLVAMNALVRPGSNIFINDFADYILHPDHAKYLVPELEPILKETYGIILYQEQTMRITRDLAGFTAGQADTVRKAMG